MLTPNDDIVKNANTKAIKAAVLEDDRHRLHAEAATSMSSASPYYKRWVKDYITPIITSKSKRDQVLTMLAWPPVSVELVDEITDMAAAVHHAQDRFVKVDLNDASLEADCKDFVERISVRSFITRNCHNQLFQGPNALVIIDAPAQQTTAFPEPYMYLIPMSAVRAAKPLTGPSDSGLFEFVWFNTEKDGITALFDQTEMALFQQNEKGGEWVEIEGSRVVHNLPFCPAFKMWDDIDDSNPFVSNSMLRPILGLLDRYLFWDAGCESNDLGTAFMMLWHLETNRPSDPPRDGMALMAGNGDQVIRPTGYLDNGTPYAPLRSSASPKKDDSKSIYGPGTRIPIPAPQNRDEPDWREPAGWIAPNVDNLKYVQDKGTLIRSRILKTATGYEAPVTKEAINEQQVLSIMERSRLVYQYLAEHYEVLERRILTALCIFRYGSSFLGCTVSYGRRVSMLTGEELNILYKAAKDNGASAWLLEEIDRQQQDYYARADASRGLRYKVYTDLNFYPNRSASDLRSLGVDQIDPLGFKITVGLEGFVHRFERENDISIEAFCNAPNYNERINQILNRFKSYIDEYEPVEPDPIEGQQPGGGKSGAKPKSGNRRPKPATV